MTDAAGGSGIPADAALAALPKELAAHSLTTSRVMLPKPAALEALALLASQGRLLESWEGWIRLSSGSRVRSLAHSGSFALPRDPKRAADTARAGIESAQARWDRDPEYPNAVLYFALSFAAT